MARKTRPSTALGPDWTGQTCYIVLGGTSVDPHEVQRLHERPSAKTLVVNSSYIVAPWADALFFADDRWYKRELQERPALLKSFRGEVWTIAEHSAAREPGLYLLRQVVPGENGVGGLAREPDTVAMQRTSTSGALNFAVHRGAARIVLIGADNRDGDNGRIHHHAEYPWPRRRTTWRVKEKQLALAAHALAALGIPVINASPISTLTWWPKTSLKDFLDKEDADARA